MRSEKVKHAIGGWRNGKKKTKKKQHDSLGSWKMWVELKMENMQYVLTDMVKWFNFGAKNMVKFGTRKGNMWGLNNIRKRMTVLSFGESQMLH